MATYSRLPAIPSKELSQIVIQSYDNLKGEDGNFDFKELERTIIRAIQKADGSNSLSATETTNSLSTIRSRTTSMTDRIEKKINSKIDEIFKELNDFSHNPFLKFLNKN